MEVREARKKPLRTIGITARTLTLEGLIDLRDRLKSEDADAVRKEFKDVYFRDEHGALRRVFPKRKRG